MQWQLDVTFKEDANTTLDKQAAQNLNIIRKWCFSILKIVEIFRHNLSMKKKRFVISMNLEELLEKVLRFQKLNFQKRGRKKIHAYVVDNCWNALYLLYKSFIINKTI